MKNNNRYTGWQIGGQSAIHAILGSLQVDRVERVARTNRVRDLLVVLGPVVERMNESEGAAYAELIALSQEEHRRACLDQELGIENESALELFSKVEEQLELMRTTNSKLLALATSIQAQQEAGVNAVPGSEKSRWRLLIERGSPSQTPKKVR